MSCDALTFLLILLLSFNQPCLAACEDQVHKFLVTHASYPNEDAFVGTLSFCLLLQKLVSCLVIDLINLKEFYCRTHQCLSIIKERT